MARCRGWPERDFGGSRWFMSCGSSFRSSWRADLHGALRFHWHFFYVPRLPSGIGCVNFFRSWCRFISAAHPLLPIWTTLWFTWARKIVKLFLYYTLFVPNIDRISPVGSALWCVNFLDLNADSHGYKTQLKVSFDTKNGQICSTLELPWQVEGLLTVVSIVKKVNFRNVGFEPQKLTFVGIFLLLLCSHMEGSFHHQ